MFLFQNCYVKNTVSNIDLSKASVVQQDWKILKKELDAWLDVGIAYTLSTRVWTIWTSSWLSSPHATEHHSILKAKAPNTEISWKLP